MDSGFQQEIYNHAANIVANYSKAADVNRWNEAARDLRFPYWDWARLIDSDQPVPEVLTNKTVVIWVPDSGNGTVEKAVNNSLFCGLLTEKHPRDAFPSPFNEWRATIRYPTSAGANAESDVKAFNE